MSDVTDWKSRERERERDLFKVIQRSWGKENFKIKETRGQKTGHFSHRFFPLVFSNFSSDSSGHFPELKNSSDLDDTVAIFLEFKFN